MANNDTALYTLRYNLVNKSIEAIEGLNWETISLTNLDGITQLIGDVSAGPGSGTQTATINAGVITNAMVSASASIALSKLAPLTPNRVLISDGSGFVAASTVTTTTLGFLDATSSIQTQLNSKQSTLTIGNLTDVGTDGIVITGGTGAVIGSGTSIAQQAASTSLNGYLTSANFTTFNNKQPAGNYITALTGDVSATGPNSATATLATVNTNVGSFTNASITVNGKGLITAASSGTAPVTSVSGTAGDISSTGGTTPVLDLVNTAVTPSTYTNATVTVDQKGRITAASSGTTPVTSVTGTANQITSTGGTTPVLALANPLTTPGGVTVTGNVTFTPTTNGIVGTTTNNNATAGNVGEYISSQVAVTTVSLSSGTAANITSISLTAGDWDVTGTVTYNPSGVAPVTDLQGGINNTTGTLPAVELRTGWTGSATTPVDVWGIVCTTQRFSLSGTTTIFLVGRASFTASTVGAGGFIAARRMR